METGKSHMVTSLGNMAGAPKLSHCTWQGIFRPPMTDVQVYCCAEDPSWFMPILLDVSFSMHP
jgi:hypothetical protein